MKPQRKTEIAKKTPSVYFTPLWDDLVALRDVDGTTKVITKAEFRDRYVDGTTKIIRCLTDTEGT